ncbi:MAG: hypothetical protein KDH89_20300, partial [Anaerolineae bacterium]|nr:hypothetical protein [Anaerolineae bacterium]
MSEQTEATRPETTAKRHHTNYRARRRRDDRRMLLAVVAFLLIVGGGLIYLIYGAGALITGLACLLFGVSLLLL